MFLHPVLLLLLFNISENDSGKGKRSTMLFRCNIDDSGELTHLYKAEVLWEGTTDP